MEHAEIKINDRWFEVLANDALPHRHEKIRCVACHSPMYFNGSYTRSGTSKFRHLRSFLGCGGSRKGALLRHPDALS
jgi:hypothetical protein